MTNDKPIMTPDTRPTVSPIEGHYAMLRNGMIARNLTAMEAYVYEAYFCDEFKGSHIFDKQGRCWSSDGIRFDRLDIIATISPANMQAITNGEYQSIKDELARLKKAIRLKGGDEHMPTMDAYQAADKAAWKHLDDLKALIPLADAACDYADANCRWFDISTAPDEEGLSFLVSIEIRNPSTIWREVHVVHLNEDGEIHTDCHQGWSLGDYTHWAPLPPLPLNPPSPAVFVELGAALERLKSQP